MKDARIVTDDLSWRRKPGADGTFPLFPSPTQTSLRGKRERGLAGISRRLLALSSLASSQGSSRLALEGSHEFRSSQRSAGVRELAQPA